MIPEEPLVFRPILKARIWGGRKLGALLNKPSPPGEKVGESWEVSDRPGDESVVALGRLKDRTIGEIMRAAPLEFLGPLGMGTEPPPRFPLLVKFIDAADVLSVQVHPDDAQAAGTGDSGKNEAWVILQADAGARMIRGLAPGATKAAFTNALKAGRLDPLLNSFPAAAGDCIACPPGMVHAIGKGVLLAEVQQNSDLTYRVYDWNRLGDDGRPRALHVEDALRCIRFDDPGDEFEGDMRSDVVEPGPWVAEEYGRSQDLLRGAHFALQRAEVTKAGEWRPIRGYQVLMVLAGAAEVMPLEEGAFVPLTLGTGSSALLPAACRSVVVRPASGGAASVLAAVPALPRPVAV